MNIAYGVLYTYFNVLMMYMWRVCIWYYVHVAYAVLCTNDAMYILDMQCYVHVVLCACCTYGVVCMIVQVVL